MTASLLHTKLHLPPPRSVLVPRPRLVEKLLRNRAAALGTPAVSELTNRLLKQCDDCFFTMQVGFVDLFAGRHHKSGHGAIVAGLYDFGKSIQLY